jgi:hypothetical protein
VSEEQLEELEEKLDEDLVCRCPETYPEDWVGQDLDMSGSCVHRMGIASFMRMPISYESYLDRQTHNIHELGLTERWPGLAFMRTGWFGGENLRFIEPAQSPSRLVSYLAPPFNVSIKLHEGGIGTVTKTAQRQQSDIISARCRPKELFLAHLSCPVCADRKGGEKIMVMRRWLPSAQLKRRMKKPK